MNNMEKKEPRREPGGSAAIEERTEAAPNDVSMWLESGAFFKIYELRNMLQFKVLTLNCSIFLNSYILKNAPELWSL